MPDPDPRKPYLLASDLIPTGDGRSKTWVTTYLTHPSVETDNNFELKHPAGKGRPYSPFEHLSRSVFPQNERLAGQVVAMFTAYLDESTGPLDIYAVAGYVATVDQWREFEYRWTAFLRREGIEVFHRTDLESFHGEFTRDKGWEEERRIRVVREAQQIIKSTIQTANAHTIGTGISSGMRKSYWDSIPLWLRQAIREEHYYTVCVHDCLNQVGRWAEQNRHNEVIQYVFEAGAIGRHEIECVLNDVVKIPELRALYRLSGRDGWTFREKQSRTEGGIFIPGFVQLQAADLLAYETYKYWENQMLPTEGKRRQIRKSLTDLLEVPHDNNSIEEANMSTLLTQIQEIVLRVLSASGED